MLHKKVYQCDHPYAALFKQYGAERQPAAGKRGGGGSGKRGAGFLVHKLVDGSGNRAGSAFGYKSPLQHVAVGAVHYPYGSFAGEPY